MSSDPPDKERPPKERARRPELDDTQELPPAKPGFFAEELRRLDPWTEVTPKDLPGESKEEPSIAVGQKEEITLSAQPVVQQDVAHAEIASTAEENEEQRAQEPDTEGEREQDGYDGDGPYAAPIDAPKPKKRLPPPRSASELRGIGFGTGAFNAPLVIARRVGNLAAGTGDRSLVPRKPSAGGIIEPDHPRRYPKMRALLKNPDRVPHGSLPPSRPKAPPVPGTFFPAPKKEKPRELASTPQDLDDMLVAMAEGLLIGEDASGHTEVRITLRDEFFAGTELRITAGEGKVSALLVPPDRSTYLELNGNIDDLRLRLEARGLRVEELRVAEP
jgi:hypothetical protein